jgi:hypothetical protein
VIPKPVSVMETLMDVLAFYQAGPYSHLGSALAKALDCLGIEANSDLIRKWRALSVHHLSAIGYLDLFNQGSQSNWSVAPNCIAQVGQAEAVAIGPTSFRNDVISRLGADAELVDTSRRRDPNLPEGIALYPRSLRIRAKIDDLEQLARTLAWPVTRNYQEKVFRLLPDLDEVIRHGLVYVDDHFLDGAEDVRRWSFDEMDWVQAEEETHDSPGLYVQKFENSRPRNYLRASSRTGQRALFEITNFASRWEVLVAAREQGAKIPLKYDPQTLELSVRDIPLPYLLERAFVSGQMKGASVIGGFRSYGGIQPSSVEKLVQAVPVFEIEEAE